MTSNHPLAEVFGFPADNLSPEAMRNRKRRLCPFGNRVPNCTKDKAQDPLGVCSVNTEQGPVITCPIRFRQRWLVASEAADFFFAPDAAWTSLTEVRLADKHGQSAGNIDIVLVAYDDQGNITDFGAIEIQAVYISGNIRRPFEYYMAAPEQRAGMDWSGQENPPRPDFLSSSRKRLAPQLLYKGGILNAWRRKMAVAVDKAFFGTLPALPECGRAEADIVWLVYDLSLDGANNVYELTHHRSVYTTFGAALDRITHTEPGPVEDFVQLLQSKLDDKLATDTPPDAPTLADVLRGQ